MSETMFVLMMILTFIPIGFFFPCGRCCITDCTIYSASFAVNSLSNFTQVSGTWNWLATGSCLPGSPSFFGHIYSDDLGAVLVADAELPSPRGIVRVNAQMATAGDTAIVIGAYADVDNYLYGKVLKNASTLTISLYEVVGGVARELGVPAEFTPSDSCHQLEICWNGHDVRFRVPASGISFGVVFGESELLGARGGVGSSAVSTGSVKFNSFLLMAHSLDYSGVNCNGCAPCASCLEATQPEQYLVTISGFTSFGGTPSCVDCADFNGTYVLDQDPGDDGTPCDYYYSDALPCGVIGMEVIQVVSDRRVRISTDAGFPFPDTRTILANFTGPDDCTIEVSADSYTTSTHFFGCVGGSGFSIKLGPA